MMKLNIKVTKEILYKSRMCYTVGTYVNDKDKIKAQSNTITNCAIALAVREIFPDAKVRTSIIQVNEKNAISLPVEAANFIHIFDHSTPEQRVEMDELEFQVELSDDIINSIDISNLDLSKSKTLKLVN